MKMDFELKGQEFIELNKLLKVLQLTESGGEANDVITKRKVRVNYGIEIQKRKKVRAGDRVEYGKVIVTVKP